MRTKFCQDSHGGKVPPIYFKLQKYYKYTFIRLRFLYILKGHYNYITLLAEDSCCGKYLTCGRKYEGVVLARGRI